MINNNSQHRVQVSVWNNVVDRVQFHLKPNRVSKRFLLFPKLHTHFFYNKVILKNYTNRFKKKNFSFK